MTIFFFLLVNNAFASIPAIQFPTFSRASMAYALAALSWVIYNGVGIHKHGLLGYLKLQSVPSGVSPVMYPLLVPLEFFSNILVRPATLALRLFANMFAGHLLLILFSTGGLFLIEYGGIGYVAGPLAWVLADRDLVPRAPGAVPPGLRLHPAQRDVHLRSARRRALIHPRHP